MYRKYEKTYRILVPQIILKGKHHLSKDECKKLLGGNVIITEKLDGANVGIIRTKDTYKLQKRGSLVDASEHYQFNFFKAWAASNQDKILQIPKNTILYGELMICKHTIFYDKLPDYFIPLALFDRKTAKYYSRKKLEELCDKIELVPAPVIYEGYTDRNSLFDLIPNISNFSSDQKAEGLVVWNFKNEMRGKVVRPEFQKSIDQSGHWAHKKITINKLEKKQ